MEVYYIREHLDKLKDKSLFYFFVIVTTYSFSHSAHRSDYA